MDFSLRVNRKAIATDSSPDRDQQFRYISSLRIRFERQGLPIISVDTKKRELVGNFKNNWPQVGPHARARQRSRFPFRCHRREEGRQPEWRLNNPAAMAARLS
jgi:hypothetical protein